MEVHETVLGKTRLTLVIPAYQESAGIAEVIEESESALEKIGLLDFEILIVDDGSTDSTFQVASKTAQKFTHTRVIKLPKNCGYGKALRKGF
ncbi:MAG: glycosyltransferase family 2 protein [Planctomycetia bacterium]